MRRVLTILLLVLLPLQWGAVAAAVVCRHAAQGGHAQGGGGATEAVSSHAEVARAAHAHGHPAHAGSGHAGNAHDARGHEGPAHEGPAHAGHGHEGPVHGADQAFGASAHADGVGLDLDCAHPDCGGCCHAAGAVLPSAPLSRAAEPVRCAPAVRPDLAPASRACESVFRPPRLSAA